jgi:hypothetical protein
MIGSAAALSPKDVITCQYRETGVFLQRGFELEDFMSQLTANRNDPGKGRNMPVHYSGKKKTNIVSFLHCYSKKTRDLTIRRILACCCLYPGYTDPTCNWCCVRAQDGRLRKP